jgi:hypothetical protein
MRTFGITDVAVSAREIARSKRRTREICNTHRLRGMHVAVRIAATQSLGGKGLTAMVAICNGSMEDAKALHIARLYTRTAGPPPEKNRSKTATNRDTLSRLRGVQNIDISPTHPSHVPEHEGTTPCHSATKN